ncbi:MAG: Holliday junction branch migration protein RuvA [Muribaculaceae bacterium]|nr:Holliday junction branch migration protein RuvA [Muribaculaceae bacterium]
MLDYIKGSVAELTPAYVVIDNNALGYYINISLYTFSALQNLKEAKLYVYENIREDAHVLYGFIDKTERELFTLLISVSGVGAGTARMIQSALRPEELKQCIASGNVNQLKSVKGIGAKTAQRIIVDLKDKINVGDDTLLISTADSNATFDEALSALGILGFPQQLSQKVLKKLFAQSPDITVEDAIKQALKMM